MKYTLTSTGNIDELEIIGAPSATSTEATSVDKDNKRVQIGGTWYSVTDSTAIFDNAEPADKDVEASNWTELKDKISTPATVHVVFKEKDNVLKAIAVWEDLVTAQEYAVVDEKGRDSDGYYLKLNMKGNVVRYDADDVDHLQAYADAARKSIVQFQASGTDLDTLTHISVVKQVYSIEQINYSNKQVKINGTWYFVDDDTVIYDVTSGVKAITFNDVLEGDRLNAPAGLVGMADNKGILHYLVINNQ